MDLPEDKARFGHNFSNECPCDQECYIEVYDNEFLEGLKNCSCYKNIRRGIRYISQLVVGTLRKEELSVS